MCGRKRGSESGRASGRGGDEGELERGEEENGGASDTFEGVN